MRARYDTCKEFKDYVDQYAKARRISIDEALTHAIVKAYAEYLEERNK